MPNALAQFTISAQFGESANRFLVGILRFADTLDPIPNDSIVVMHECLTLLQEGERRTHQLAQSYEKDSAVAVHECPPFLQEIHQLRSRPYISHDKFESSRLRACRGWLNLPVVKESWFTSYRQVSGK